MLKDRPSEAWSLSGVGGARTDEFIIGFSD
jgi:hypothetical protein